MALSIITRSVNFVVIERQLSIVIFFFRTVSILGAMMCLFSIGAMIKTGYNLGTEKKPYNVRKLSFLVLSFDHIVIGVSLQIFSMYTKSLIAF